MSIIVKSNTRAKETQKLANHMRSYLFEQEYGELRAASKADVETLREALQVLHSIIKSKTNNHGKEN